MKYNHKKMTPIGLSVLIAIHSASLYAQEDDVITLAPLVVETANENSVSHTITDLSADEIFKSSIRNIEDTTRYVPGVQVNDNGNRYNDNGFNIRGLEGDDVAVTIDGVSLGETIAPPSFSAYGMYDATRGQVELEHVKAIRITKGPSAVTNGSSALAGAVAYTTNDAGDFLDDQGNDASFGVNSSYDSRSDQRVIGASLANRSGIFETLLQVTSRDGNETESFGSGLDISGPTREIADPFSTKDLSVLAKLAINLTPDQQLGFVYDRKDSEAEGTPLSRNFTDEFPTFYDQFETNDDNDRERYGLFYTWDNADNALFDSLSASLNVQDTFTRGQTAFLFSISRYANPSDAFLRTEDRSTSSGSESFNLDFTKRIEGGVSHDLSYGVKFEQRDVTQALFDIRYNGTTTSTGLIDGSPVLDQSFVPNTDTDVFNVYVRDEIQVNDRLKITAGFRYDETDYSPELGDNFSDVTTGVDGVSAVDDADFNALVGSLVVEYEFLEGHSFLASYSEGYKAPTIQDLYLDTEGASLVVGDNGANLVDLDVLTNPNLEAEESSSIEIGYKLETDRFNLTVTAYKTDYENQIRNIVFSEPFGTSVTTFGRAGASVATVDQFTQAQNTGAVDVQGIEIDGTIAWTDNLYSTFTYATIDGEYLDTLDIPINGHLAGDDLETAAPDSATLSLGFRDADDKWGTSLTAVWADSVDENDDLSFTSLNNGAGVIHFPSSYTAFDLNGFYNFSDNLRLSATVFNITDKEYLRWEVVNSVRPGSGGFFGGAAEDGFRRFSDPGRSFSLNVNYSF